MRRQHPDTSDNADLNEVAVEAVEGAGSLIDVHTIPLNLTVNDACNATATTPLCLRTLYGTLSYKPQVPGRSRMAVVNNAGQLNNRSDIALFLATYRPDAVAGAQSFQDIGIAGGANQQTPATPEQIQTGAGREGNQDAETMLGIAHPVRLTTYTVGDVEPPFTPDLPTPTNTNEPFLTRLDLILSLPDSDLPSVVSTSYADLEDTVPLSYAERVCRRFAQLGARGVSVIMGAGDQGVGRHGKCFLNDGGSLRPRFQVKFPESCPWVTSVGSTRGIGPRLSRTTRPTASSLLVNTGKPAGIAIPLGDWRFTCGHFQPRGSGLS
jgi:tripeptidyl-peptidase-1